MGTYAGVLGLLLGVFGVPAAKIYGSYSVFQKSKQVSGHCINSESWNFPFAEGGERQEGREEGREEGKEAWMFSLTAGWAAF